MSSSEESSPQPKVKPRSPAPRKSQAADEEPFTVRNKNGQTEIVVYPNKAREGYAFGYRLGGVRKTIERVTREKIIAAALKIAADIDSGVAQAGQLTATDVESYTHARKLLLPGDPPLHAIVAEWQAARAQLGVTGSLLDAARLWSSTHPDHVAGRKTVSEVIAEMIERKRHGRRRLDPQYLKLMEGSLRKFGVEVGTRPVGEVTEKEIYDYLVALKHGPRTRHNHHARIISLFRFARLRRYLPADRTTEAEKVEKEHWVRRPPDVFTADELRTLLAHVRENFKPWMVLGAFAGIRTEEICGDEKDPEQAQLEWRDVLWDEKQIHVRPEVGKTDEGRFVPIEANLLEWLLKWRDRTGFVCPKQAPYRQEVAYLQEKTKIKWRKNGLRHSYGTYRFALDRDLQKLTAAMGNSPNTNRRYYQNPQPPQLARAWFDTRPRDVKVRVIVPGQFGK